MRYQGKFKTGEVKSQLVNGESWIEAVNHLLESPNIAEILSVKNLRDVPLSEQISLVESMISGISRTGK
jgi:hypothetical protein